MVSSETGSTHSSLTWWALARRTFEHCIKMLLNFKMVVCPLLWPIMGSGGDHVLWSLLSTHCPAHGNQVVQRP